MYVAADGSTSRGGRHRARNGQMMPHGDAEGRCRVFRYQGGCGTSTMKQYGTDPTAVSAGCLLVMLITHAWRSCVALMFSDQRRGQVAPLFSVHGNSNASVTIGIWGYQNTISQKKELQELQSNEINVQYNNSDCRKIRVTKSHSDNSGL